MLGVVGRLLCLLCLLAPRRRAPSIGCRSNDEIDRGFAE